jgi:hypothetical protein
MDDLLELGLGQFVPHNYLYTVVFLPDDFLHDSPLPGM